MAVKRVVANLKVENFEAARRFYADLLGMETVMDHGWILALGGEGQSLPQLGFAMQGGSGAPVPDLSVEVDDFEAVQQRITEAGLAFEYGPAAEPWGVRRFYVRDPFGRLVNILSHI